MRSLKVGLTAAALAFALVGCTSASDKSGEYKQILTFLMSGDLPAGQPGKSVTVDAKGVEKKDGQFTIGVDDGGSKKCLTDTKAQVSLQAKKADIAGDSYKLTFYSKGDCHDLIGDVAIDTSKKTAKAASADSTLTGIADLVKKIADGK